MAFPFLLVHVDDYASAYSDPGNFAAWLQHFGGDPNTHYFLDVQLLGDVTNLLQMRIIRTQSTVCLDKERQITQLAIENMIASPSSRP